MWDRDVILDTSYKRDGDKLELVFQNVKSDLRPLPESTVRMPMLKGFYKMKQLAPNKTEVLYEVEADIGGSFEAVIVSLL